MNIFVGIDLSLTSPAVAIYNQKEKHIIVYFYSQRKRYIRERTILPVEWRDCSKFILSPFKTDKIDTSLHLYCRYHIIVSDILGCLQPYLGMKLMIRIEGYAFGISSCSGSILYEIGGILRYHLYSCGLTWEDIPPTSLKKKFTMSGSATKNTMYEHFVRKGFPDLFELLSINDRICTDCIPNPIQDIVDACALIDSFDYT